MERKYRVIAALNILMALLFIFAAVVQYNDPDNIQWMLLYGLAAFSSLLWFTNYFKKIIPFLVMTIALIWIAFLLPDVMGQGTFSSQMFDSFKMNNIEVELAREVGGLLIIVFWMAVLFFISHRK